MHKFYITENGDTALAVCQGEHVIMIVSGVLLTPNFVDLELEQCLWFGMVYLGISKGHIIILAAHSCGLPIGTLAGINALSFEVHCLCVL